MAKNYQWFIQKPLVAVINGIILLCCPYASEQSTGATIAISLTLTIIPVTAAIIVLVIVILRLQKRRQSVNEELVPEPVTENLYVIQEDSK